jgi:hypothetical protein
MKAISTKYLPCTNSRGARIKAFDMDGNSVTVSYDHALSGEDVHRVAAETLRDKMHWKGELIGGAVKGGSYVFVFDAGRADLLAAVKAFLRAPSIGSSGPGSVTIEVQTFNLKAARAAIAKAEQS